MVLDSSHPERRSRVESPEAISFLLVPEPLLPEVQHPCRVPVENVEEAEFLAAALQEHRGLYLGAWASEYHELAAWADATPLGVRVGSACREGPLGNLSELPGRVPVRWRSV
ncbi:MULTISPECIES: hypothetical protein [Corallococcus]|uniref:hypothetical protein n=1 Tax=Corallococcus TaxID=83461 RepID=UPI00163DBF9F|nr:MULTISPECIES: hypothetical protein [Corallococcus]